jgi:hypothetical protein
MMGADSRKLFHPFWDDIDELKVTDFMTEVLFDPFLLFLLFCTARRTVSRSRWSYRARL